MERKVKYGYTFKLECVNLVVKEHYSAEYVSRLKEPNKTDIRKWVSFYESYGKIGLIPRKNHSYLIFQKKNLHLMLKKS